MGTLEGKLSRVRARAALAVLVAILVAACDSTTPTPPPNSTVTVRITATGMSPKSVDVALGGRVLFINQDSRDHTIGSDPHPDHSDCPDLNQVGLLQPGQRRETANLVQPRVCGFHDHDLPNVTTLTGTITIR